MRVTLLAVSLLFTSHIHLLAQLSFGGKPYYTGTLKIPEQEVPFVVMPEPKIDTASTNNPNTLKALRFAHPFFVNLSPDNSGRWTSLADGTNVWRLGIKSANAYSLNLIFDRFKLPSGAKLFIFTPDLSSVLGAFTDQSHQSDGVFATTPIAGDEIILEYSQPADVEEKPKILLSAINHDYRNVFGLSSLKVGYFGDSDSCQPDISCVSGSFPEEKSVCRLIIDGTELCSGTFVNNTRNDGTPYFISAAHCLKSGVTNHSFLLLFNYQVPDCNTTIEGYKLQTLSGGSIVALMTSLDCLLLKMDQTPPASFRPYYAGWDLTELPLPPYHSIHHPQGDVKKFSRSTATAVPTTFTSDEITFDPLGHLRIQKWLTGTTQSGSSGCGLFNGNGQLLGCLSGGYATCSNPINDYYFRISKAWEYSPAPDEQLKKWLDPDNVGSTKLNGIDIHQPSSYKRISNRADGDSAIYVDNTSNNPIQWMGNNSLGIDAFAERFDSVESCTLQGLYLMAGKSYMNGSMHVKIWSEMLFSQNQSPVLDTTIYLSSIKGMSENLILLKDSIKLRYPISVSVELPDNLFANFFQYNTKRKGNSAYLRKDGLWYAFNKLHPTGLNSSAYIDLLASSVVIDNSNIVTEPKKRVTVYPNPAIDKITMQWGIDYLKKVEVLNLNGQTLISEPYGFSYGKEQLDLSNLAQGIYLMRFTFEGITMVEKVIVSR